MAWWMDLAHEAVWSNPWVLDWLHIPHVVCGAGLVCGLDLVLWACNQHGAHAACSTPARLALRVDSGASLDRVLLEPLNMTGPLGCCMQCVSCARSLCYMQHPQCWVWPSFCLEYKLWSGADTYCLQCRGWHEDGAAVGIPLDWPCMLAVPWPNSTHTPAQKPSYNSQNYMSVTSLV